MAHDYSIGIIGAGPAGCTVAHFLDKSFNITLIDNKPIMSTVLPTGGGRCNLAYAEYDYKELVKNYPRGEKFLYSIFSKFSTSDTIELFSKLGIGTYTQEDMRIFPTSNSSKDVQEKFTNALKNISIKREEALRIEIEKDKIKVVTDYNSYYFDKLIVATGSHRGFEMIKRIGISVTDIYPSLVGFTTSENFKSISGLSIKNVQEKNTHLSGDILFTHYGVSGPLIYKISSIKAKEKSPYTLSFNLINDDIDLQQLFNDNPHKQIHNLLSEFIPKNFVKFILNKQCIDLYLECHLITKDIRESIKKELFDFKITTTGTKKDGETVNCGGVDLKSINPKTLESKEIPNIYFCGEILDIDGFCGGFNLQNCWSTGFVVASAINN